MKLRKFENKEELKPLPKETAESVLEFGLTYGKEIGECIKYMHTREYHPVHPIIPYIHARQMDIERNIIISLENVASPKLIINPKVLVKDKRFIQKGIQLSDSFEVEGREGILIPFLTERATEIQLLYDTLSTDKLELEPEEKKYTGDYSILLQEMADYSLGKLITRFPEQEIKEE